MPRLDSANLQLEPRHLALLRQLLAQHTPTAEVWAYGSRVAGGAHECSDLDLVLRNPADLHAASQGWMALKTALQESRLPMLVELHDWAHLPPAFHREIERAYVVLQQPGECNCEPRGKSEIEQIRLV